MKLRGIIFSRFATRPSATLTDRPAIGPVGLAHDRRHDGVLAGQGELDGCFAHGVRLLDVDLRCDVPRRALQVVGDRVVVLEPEPAATSSASVAATPPSCAWPKASVVPASARKRPSASRAPSDTTTTQYSLRATLCSTRARNAASSNGISGKTMMCGASVPTPWARPAAAAIQPACRPMTSRMNTFVEVLAIEATSSAASGVETATYFATEPKPGQVSVIGRSLSTVFGMPMQVTGKPSRLPDLRDLVGGVHRVAAAVVEEVADVVGFEDLDEPLVLGEVRVQAFELVAGRAEGAARAYAATRRWLPCFRRSCL